MTITPRINRMFGADGKCLNVAMDHGMFNEYNFLSGIENMTAALETVVSAGPDAIQLSPGQAKIYQDIPAEYKPALVLRTDVANVYGKELPAHTFSELVPRAVEQAVKLDAACIVVNVFLLPNQSELYHQCIKNVASLKIECERYGMPLMVEPLVMQPNDQSGGYMVDGDIRKIVPLVRQAVELGADIIKADPCDDVSEYHVVIEAAGRKPVLPRGGGKAADSDIIARTVDLMSQGAMGIVYGRNIIQHRSPQRMTQALMAVVHHHASSDDAVRILNGGAVR